MFFRHCTRSFTITSTNVQYFEVKTWEIISHVFLILQCNVYFRITIWEDFTALFLIHDKMSDIFFIFIVFLGLVL